METMEPALPRAGFWQRTLAFCIDCAIVGIPFAALAGLLFFLSDGSLQFRGPILKFSSCKTETTIRQDLRPPPPDQSNFSTACKVYSIGGMTANILIVGKTTKSGIVTSTVSTEYLVNARNEIVQGQDVTWILDILVFAFIIILQWRFGRTVGQRILSCKLVDIRSLDKIGINIGHLILRYAIMFGVPIISAGVLWLPLGFMSFEEIVKSSAYWLVFSVVVLFNVIWGIWNIVLIVQLKDPFFDRWSGLAEINMKVRKPVIGRTRPPATPPPLPHP